MHLFTSKPLHQFNSLSSATFLLVTSFPNLAMKSSRFNMTGSHWLKEVCISGPSPDNTAMTPLVEREDEAGSDNPYIPTMLNSYEYFEQMSIGGALGLDIYKSHDIDEHGFRDVGHVQPQLLDSSTPLDTCFCSRIGMNRDEWTPSERYLLLSSMPRRRQSIQSGSNNTMQTVTEKCCSTASDDAFSTTSSVTLPGDDMLQLQSDDEADDEDYDDTNDRHQTLREQERQILDDISNLCKNLSRLEISIDAVHLGGYDAASFPTQVHNICCMNNELHDDVRVLWDRLSALNTEATELGATVEIANERATRLKTEIEDMDPRSLLIDAGILNSQLQPIYTPVRDPLQEDSFHRYPHAHSPYEIPMPEGLPYSYGRQLFREYSSRASYQDDTSLSAAAAMHAVPPRHAGQYGPSADHASDLWQRSSSTTSPVPHTFNFPPQSPPVGLPEAQETLPEHLDSWVNHLLCKTRNPTCHCQQRSSESNNSDNSSSR